MSLLRYIVRSAITMPRKLNISTASVLYAAPEEGEGEEPPKEKPVPPEKDRRVPVPVETSIRYMKSDAFKEAYGEDAVWVLYRRNQIRQFAPLKTRLTCIKNGIIATGSPCPICRDEYLIVDYRNVELLKQFVSPNNGAVLSAIKTHVCRRQHLRLQVAVQQAKEYGLLIYDVPFREYDYSLYQK